MGLAASRAHTQDTFGFFDRGPYREVVPRPDGILGYAAGDRQTQFLQQQAVLDQMITAAQDRVRTKVIGTTEEGRIMRVLLSKSAIDCLATGLDPREAGGRALREE